MKYDINSKNIKSSAKNLGEYLKDFSIPHSKILEGLARSLFQKNWNTLEGIIKSPEIINQYTVEKKYLFEIDVNISKETMLSWLKECFNKANANLEISNFKNNKNYFHIEIDLRKSDVNILTAMFLLAERLKPYDVKSFDYCRISCEKQSFMEYFRRSN